jgi:MerR family transcriptional regulator, light-induced transcriptional regulator
MGHPESSHAMRSPVPEATRTAPRHVALKRRTRMTNSPEINQLVVDDIVPHLVRSLARPDGESAASDWRRFNEEVVREFTSAVLDVDEQSAMRFIDRLLEDGVSIESLYLGLFAASARMLGEYWKADALPFTEVTLGLWRLHRLVRDISRDFSGQCIRGTRFLQALLTTAPGEQHSFGLVLVSEWFRRAGWNVVPGPLQTSSEIARAVSTDCLAVVGFSASTDLHLDRLAATIELVRRKSRNKSIGVMVGGAIFNRRPELVAQVGADMTATDAAEALAKAQRFAVCGQWGT